MSEKNKVIYEKNRIIIKNASCFQPDMVFDCGQCFRFDRMANGHYHGVAKNRYIEVYRNENDVIIENCTKKDYDDIFCDFFDMDFDYEAAASELSVDDTLRCAAEYGSGIRILHQDCWEALISFIISQNNNIPRIKGIIKNLSERYGEPIHTDKDGAVHYSFPTPQKILEAGEEGMALLKTGFRAKYIYDAALKVTSGEIDLDAPLGMNYSEAVEYLCKIKGVGVKVASCVLLFSYRKYDSFPVDVWVKRILEKYYGGNVGAEYFGKYAGLSQQYLFYYERCVNNVYINK